MKINVEVNNVDGRRGVHISLCTDIGDNSEAICEIIEKLEKGLREKKVTANG